MKKLVLFDIDGTLISSPPNNLHNIAFAESIKNLTGVDVVVPHGKFSGLTDQLILGELLKEHKWDAIRIDSIMPRLVIELENVYLQKFQKGSITLLPGIKDLLTALDKQGVTLGLVTGGLQRIAEIKLKDVGILSYFTAGGFGSDPHTKRSQLVEIAAHRAGFTIKNNPNVYLIGDTPRDIQAGIDASVVNKIGVATHTSTTRQLKDSGADMTFEDLNNTKSVLEAFRM